MGEINWFRRGDGAEFAVQPGSEAEINLIASGALHIEGPGAGQDDPAAEPTKAELVERARELGLSTSGTKADLSKAIAAAEVEATTAPEAEAPGDGA